MMVSAVIAARDEEEMIEGALRSLAFCDEIVVVVDDRSTDRTEEIARRYTDKVLVEPFVDFAQIRNAGIRATQGEWILHVDADERQGDPPYARCGTGGARLPRPDHQFLLGSQDGPRRLGRDDAGAADPPRAR
jgi:glycosyltransferase involved in cell wall biosynthesis